MRKTGRNSPFWGILSLAVVAAIETFVLLVLIYFNPGVMNDDGKMDESEQLIAALTSMLSIPITILLFYILSLIIKKSNFRNKEKNTTINYKYVSWVAITLLVFGSVNSVYTYGLHVHVQGLLVTSAIFAIVITVYCYRFYRQTQVPSISEKLDQDKRKPVLLLRSFNEEKDKAIRVNVKTRKEIPYSSFLENVIIGYTFDELLTPLLEKKIGSVVALGDPNDYLPSLGSSKLYSPDCDDEGHEPWWDLAVELMKKSKVNIVFESYGNNITRELRYIRNHLSPHNIVIITYPSLFKKDEKMYSSFRKTCENANIKIPTIPVNRGCVITFDSDWNYNVSESFNNNFQGITNYIYNKTI